MFEWGSAVELGGRLCALSAAGKGLLRSTSRLFILPRQVGSCLRANGDTTLSRNFDTRGYSLMETCLETADDVQPSAQALRLARRILRQTPPIRWSGVGLDRKLRVPWFRGAEVFAGQRFTLTEREARWLVSLLYWGTVLLCRFRTPHALLDSALQEAFNLAAIRWRNFPSSSDLPPRIARRRWLALILFEIAERYRNTIDLPRCEPIAADRPETMLSVEHFIARLPRFPDPEQWRIWIAREVDGVDLPEIARQEGRSCENVCTQLLIARNDLVRGLRPSWSTRKRSLSSRRTPAGL